MNKDLEYVKSLYVMYEEWDPEEEGSFYTNNYTIGERFSDDEIKDAMDELDDDEEDWIFLTVNTLVENYIVGDLKSMYIKDKDGKVLKNEEY